MHLTDIYLRSFRNYDEVTVEFEPGVNLIVGDNAQGKTNLLEAISYLGSGKSFRAQKTSEMIRFGADFAEIHLTLCRPLLLLPPIPPSIRVFSNESTLRMRWPKYWSFDTA